LKHSLLVLLTSLILGACTVPPIDRGPVSLIASSINTTSVPLEFVAIDPRASLWYEKETSAGLKRIFWEEIGNKAANADLPIERSFVSITKITGDTTIGFASAKLTAEAGKYRTVLDYGKFRDEVMGEAKTPVRVGVGVRIVANITTAKANIDLGSLFAIAFAAKSGYLSGQIEVIKIGIDSPELNLVLPPPTDINDTSLQAALQAVAAIRAKLYDEKTNLRPHILAVQYTPLKP